MERKKMTPKEFSLFWDKNRCWEEYGEAQSETEKLELLKKWGVPDMYVEAERNMWLLKILVEYGPEGVIEPAAMSVEELEEQAQQFELYLRNFPLRDYERESLMESYLHERGIVAFLEDLREVSKHRNIDEIKIPEDIKEGLRELGILGKIGVTS